MLTRVILFLLGGQRKAWPMEDLGVLEVVESVEPGEGLVWGLAGSLCNLGGAGKGCRPASQSPREGSRCALEGEALGRKGQGRCYSEAAAGAGGRW